MHKDLVANAGQSRTKHLVVTDVLPSLLTKKRALLRMRSSIDQVDGAIIGTGALDFTTGNVEYQFSRAGKSFQLVDVPGIEGDEARFESLVKQAIAKAHLVFFVNGTNKKPEARTAEKIRKYLRQNAFVHAICNLRGKADSYEDDDQRVALERTHKDAGSVQQQTREVLEAVLGKSAVLGVQSVQGMLGFCGVAYDAQQRSTITPQRPDLVKSQRSFARDFGSAAAMRRFSQMDSIAEVIEGKFATFEQDIVESNKAKVVSLIDDTLLALRQYLAQHQLVSAEVSAQIEHCRKAIEARVASFGSGYENKRRNAVAHLFSAIDDGLYDIIRDDFDDKDDVERNAKRLVAKEQKNFAERLEHEHIQMLADFTEQVSSELLRLEEDIKRLQFQQSFKSSTVDMISLNGIVEAIEFNLKDVGGILLNIGSYALAGMSVGSALPVVGNIVGAIAGAIVGVISSALSYFFGGKDKKIRAAQSKSRENVDEARDRFMPKFSDETQRIIGNVKAEVVDKILRDLGVELTRMAEVKHIIEKQISAIETIKNNVVRSGYGTV